MLRAGMKVICVNADYAPQLGAGEIYTVLKVITYPNETPGILLHETIPSLGFESFESLRFRPVCDRPTDISFALEILRKASRQKEETA